MVSQTFFNNPIKLKRCTGLTPDQFTLLVKRVSPLWDKAERKRLSRPDRKRLIGAGHPYRLQTTEEKVFCLLLWYKLYPALWFLGMMVSLDASNVYRLIQRLRPLLAQAADPSLGNYFKESQRTILTGRKKISSWEDLQREFPEVAEIFIDATEQQKQRPKKRVQKKYYSGKKKRHTLKTQLVVNGRGKILHISKTYPGSIHDYAVFKKERTAEAIPKQSRSYGDKGFIGVNKDYPGLDFRLPIKRNRFKKTLTRSEKIFNTKLAKKRVVVEHVISKLKKYTFLAQVFRGKIASYNQDFKNIATLVNFRLASAT